MFNKSLLRAMGYMKPYIPIFIVAVILAGIASAAGAAPALIVQQLVNKVLINKDMRMLWILAGSIVAMTFVKGIMTYYRQAITDYISSKIIHDISNDVYLQLQKMSLSFYSRMNTGEILARFTNDAQKVQGVITSIFAVMTHFFTALILIVGIFKLNFVLACMTVIALPIMTHFVRKFSKRIKSTGKKIQEQAGIISSFLQEIMSGIRVIKAFGTEDYEIKRFKEKNYENFKITYKNNRIKARVTPVIEFFNSISLAMILLYGGYEVIKGDLTAGSLIGFLTAVGLMYDPIKRVAGLINDIQTSRHSADRIFEIIDIKPDIEDKENAIEIEECNGVVEIKNLNFKYDIERDYVLKNINLKAEKGEVVALVGKSGSGKTTLVNLIPRFYEVNEGEIVVSGHEIKDVTMKSLRKNMAIVPQETFLFSGTIYDNICYGSENVKKEDVLNAAQKANALEFIEKLPDGFDTQVGERGVLLSGGQKQRIAIARAILKNPKILILDEATSALDTESEKLVQEALDKVMKDRTTFVIAHRLSTIISADKIVVMESGEIKEIGKHSELLEKDGIYRKLYDTQFSE